MSTETGSPAASAVAVPRPASDVALEDLAAYIVEELEAVPPATQNRLRRLYDMQHEKVLGLREGYDVHRVEEAGWGLFLAKSTPQDVKDALADLIRFRTPKGQEPRIYTYTGQDADGFRKSKGEDYGLVDPNNLPYYFLLVGPPSEIPYEFQYNLDIAHAVGRLFFETAAEYRRYVKGVLDYEAGNTVARERRVAVFSPTPDRATRQSARALAKPLAEHVHGRALEPVMGDVISYQVERKSGVAAKHSALEDLLRRDTHQPTLLFAATHGQRPDNGHTPDVGALLCHGDAYFSGGHVSDDLVLDGLVCFVFACHSSGTPPWDGRYAAISYLPQRLLGQGALAFLGHVGPAHAYSYGWPGYGRLTGTFEDTLVAILMGQRIGHAFDKFRHRYLALNDELTRRGGWRDRYCDEESIEQDLVEVWTARNDARAYTLFGDPAVCLKPQAMQPAAD